MLRIGAGRQHREIARIVELAVHREAEQADEQLVVPHDDRHRRRGHVGGVAGDHQIDVIDLQQFDVDARDVGRVGLVVVEHQLDRTAEQSALGVDVLGPDLRGEHAALPTTARLPVSASAKPMVIGWPARRDFPALPWARSFAGIVVVAEHGGKAGGKPAAGDRSHGVSPMPGMTQASERRLKQIAAGGNSGVRPE